MSARNRHDRRSDVERLESRDVPTFVLIHHPGLTAASERAASDALASLGASGHVSAADAPTTPVPTAHELIRETYHAGLRGSYNVGPGRFTNQSAQVSSIGAGGSNQSFHLDYQMRIVIPKDPTASTTGVIALFPWNVATTGTVLILDLTADPTSVSSATGLPTHYTWTVDPASGGIYSNAGGYGTGSGTLDMSFSHPVKGRGAVSQTGQVAIKIAGLINTGGVFNVIGNVGNIAKHP